MKMNLPDDYIAHYEFGVDAPAKGTFGVMREICRIYPKGEISPVFFYDIKGGELGKNSGNLQAAVARDRLYLPAISGSPGFRSVFKSLTNMGFYNMSPEKIRELQDPDPARVLSRDGGNITSIIKHLQNETNSTGKTIIEEYLEKIVQGISGFNVKALGPKETVEFRQVVKGSKNPWKFLAANMSDGTLRVLGVLVALFQSDSATPVPLIGIEEPESALHPYAVNMLASAILEAKERTQVLVTSHSSELLDHDDIDSESILAVISKNGETIVGPVDAVAKKALRENLYTAGELLRIGQIEPDPLFLRSHTGSLFSAEDNLCQ